MPEINKKELIRKMEKHGKNHIMELNGSAEKSLTNWTSLVIITNKSCDGVFIQFSDDNKLETIVSREIKYQYNEEEDGMLPGFYFMGNFYYINEFVKIHR